MIMEPDFAPILEQFDVKEQAVIRQALQNVTMQRFIALYVEQEVTKLAQLNQAFGLQAVEMTLEAQYVLDDPSKRALIARNAKKEGKR